MRRNKLRASHSRKGTLTQGFRRVSPLTRFAQGREIIHNAQPGQTFTVGDREYLVNRNGSFRRLGAK